MSPLLCSAYLPPISFFIALNGRAKALVERYDNYKKQTYRNRCVIAAANGPLALSIPVEKGPNAKQLMKDVRISDHSDWRHSHWTALESAYMNSPFFLFYQDDFRPIYEKRHIFLFDLNMELWQKIIELIDISVKLSPTDIYSDKPEGIADYRPLIEPDFAANKNARLNSPYYQVFQRKSGFIPNLSVVDLLFNMGPESQLVLNGYSK